MPLAFIAAPAASAVPPVVLLVGPDGHGRWLVQATDGNMEGSFVSRDAAMGFARWERHAYPQARVELTETVLTPHFALAA